MQQLKFIESDNEIQVGSIEGFPLSLEELKDINETSKYVEKVFKSGLTATVYKLKINNKFYNLKKKREKILVHYEFLKDNESLFLGDEKLEKEQLVEKYKTINDLVIKYQL